MGTGSLESEYPLSPEKRESEEPFECPNCGQLLDFRCRVCVACGEAVDPARISQANPPEISPAPVEQAAPRPVVPIPWGSCLLLLLASFAAATLMADLLGNPQAQFVFQGFQVLCAVWVFHDARYYAIPRPLRWSLGTLFLWVILFPWYLVRRRRLGHACPFVEESPHFARTVVIINLLLFLIIVLYVSLAPGPIESPEAG